MLPFTPCSPACSASKHGNQFGLVRRKVFFWVHFRCRCSCNVGRLVFHDKEFFLNFGACWHFPLTFSIAIFWNRCSNRFFSSASFARTLIWPSSFRRGGLFSSRFRAEEVVGQVIMYLKCFRRGKTYWDWLIFTAFKWGHTTQTSTLGGYQQPHTNEFSRRRQETTENRHCWGWQWTICLQARIDAFHGCKFGVASAAGATFGQFFSGIGAVRSFLFSKQKL